MNERTQQDRDNAKAAQLEIDKGIVKEAIKEWLDAQFASFGRWTFYGLLSLALAGAIYLAIVAFMAHLPR